MVVCTEYKTCPPLYGSNLLFVSDATGGGAASPCLAKPRHAAPTSASDSCESLAAPCEAAK